MMIILLGTLQILMMLTKLTNAAILDAQGNANNITSVDSSYFRNFERIDSYRK